MRVAFLKPPIGGILGLEMLTFVEPLGPISIAGGLEAEGHTCKILDLRIEGEDQGMELCRSFAPDLVGLQCNFTTERFRLLRLAERVRRDLPHAFVLVGGHDAVPGLVLNRDGRQIATGAAPAREDLDSLPMPARHLIAHYADRYYINFRKPLALMETARGCPFKCNFCSVWKFHHSTFREKSPERVVAELRAIDAPNVFITDDIFWMDVRRVEEMARQIKAAGIRKYFTVQLRG